jgi:hypothetical protein
MRRVPANEESKTENGSQYDANTRTREHVSRNCSGCHIARGFIADFANKKNLRLKTNNKSTLEAQSANYLKSRTDYTTQGQLVNAKQETTNSILHRNIHQVTDPQKLHARTLTK